jgi:hypothetical protein
MLLASLQVHVEAASPLQQQHAIMARSCDHTMSQGALLQLNDPCVTYMV